MARKHLFYEERISILRKMLNEHTVRLTKNPDPNIIAQEIRNFALQAIAICDGDASAVPEEFKSDYR